MRHRENTLIPTEYQECKAYWEWAQYDPMLRTYLMKIVNEGKRSKYFGQTLKAIGWRKGVPDYHYPVANDTWCGLWIEMKRRKKSQESKEQLDWIENLLAVKQYATVAYGWEDAVKITLAYIRNQI